MDGGLHPLQLVHQLLVHVEPAGGIQKHHVAAVVPGVAESRLGDLHRVSLSLFKHRQLQLSPHHLQLFNGGGTVHVAGGQQRALFQLPPHQASQLGGGGGLARALETHHHYHGGTVVGHGDLGIGPTHELSQLLIDNLHHLLGRGKAVQHVNAHSPLRYGGHKVLDHLVAHVGLQQGQPDLPHGLPDVVLRQTALAPQALKCGAQFFSQSLKCHGSVL